MEGLASMLMTTDMLGWWLVKAGVAVAISFKKDNSKILPRHIDSSFHEQYFWSTQCYLIAFDQWQDFFQNELIFSSSAPALSIKFM